MIANLLRVAVIAASLLSAQLFAADYYVRNGGNNSNSGLSDAQAWATPLHAAANVGPNDTIYLKRGDSWTLTATIEIVDDGVTIDAYGSGALPYIDGNRLGWPAVSPTSIARRNTNLGYTSAFQIKADNVTINRVDMFEVGIGIRSDCRPSVGGPYVGSTVNEVRVDTAYQIAIQFLNGCENTTITNNFIRKAAWGYGENYELFWPGALGVTRNGSGADNPPTNNFTITGNVVTESYGEGIILFGEVNDGIVRDNVLWNIRAVGIYCDGCYDIDIHDNLVYCGIADGAFHRSQEFCGSGLYTATEALPDGSGGLVPKAWNSTSTVVRDVSWRNNLVVGTTYCIQISRANYNGTADHVNNEWVNNTCIDNWRGIARNGPTGRAGAGVQIQNNAFITNRANTYTNAQPGDSDEWSRSFPDADWNLDRNYWDDGQPDLSNMRGPNDIYGPSSPLTVKTSGWRTSANTLGGISKSDAQLVTGSPLLGASAAQTIGILNSVSTDITWSNKSIAATSNAGELLISGSTSHPGQGKWYTVCDQLNQAPTKQQALAGQNAQGVAADWFSGEMNVGSNPQQVTATGLSGSRHDCWIYQVVTQ